MVIMGGEGEGKENEEDREGGIDANRVKRRGERR